MFDPERAELEAKIERLQAIVEAQAALIVELRSLVEELQSRLGKDSGNSSLPPCRDRTDRRARRAAEAKERREARKALGAAARKPGKQEGAPGATLARRTPTGAPVLHAAEVCADCGASLADAPVVGTATRQVLEIPEPRLEVIDHVVECRRCTSCGCKTRGQFPPRPPGRCASGPG